MDRGDTKTRFARYIWLMESLNHGMTCFEDFQNDWKSSRYVNSMTETLSRRTLSNLFVQIKEQFGIEISKSSGSYRYHLLPMAGIADRLQKFLVNCKDEDFQKMEESVSDKILNQHVGSKTEEYEIAVEALYHRQSMTFNYHHMADAPTASSTAYQVYPYGIKYYNKHWYLFGRVLSPLPTDRLERFFILNKSRMSDCKLSNQDVPDADKISKDMKSSFESYYGVITGDASGEIAKEKVVLRVYTANKKHEYYRETPLHSSQKELKPEHPGDETDPSNFIRFSYEIAPTFDFIQKLLSDREDVVVEEPRELRAKMKDIIQKMADRYTSTEEHKK